MQIFIVGIALADVAGQAVDGQVHLAQPDRFGHLLLAVDGELGAGVLLVLRDETGALDEHAAGAAGRVEDAALEGFDDADDELDDGGGGEELAALLALAHGEVAEEVFVDLAEGVSLDVYGDGVHRLEQFLEQGVLEAVVGLGEHVFEVGVLRLDGPHGLVDGRADVGPLGERDQRREAGRFGKVKDTAGLIVRRADFPPSAASGSGQVLGRLLKLVVGVAQKHEPQHRDGVFGGFQLGISPQLVGRGPEAGFDGVAVVIH